MRGPVYNNNSEEFIRGMFLIGNDLKNKIKRVKDSNSLNQLKAKWNTLRDALAIFDRTITRIQPLKKVSSPKAADSVHDASDSDTASR